MKKLLIALTLLIGVITQSQAQGYYVTCGQDGDTLSYCDPGSGIPCWDCTPAPHGYGDTSEFMEAVHMRKQVTIGDKRFGAPTGIGLAVWGTAAQGPILPPGYTTTNRSTFSVTHSFGVAHTGALIYNSTIGAFEYWNGSAWVQVGTIPTWQNTLVVSGGSDLTQNNTIDANNFNFTIADVKNGSLKSGIGGGRFDWDTTGNSTIGIDGSALRAGVSKQFGGVSLIGNATPGTGTGFYIWDTSKLFQFNAGKILYAAAPVKTTGISGVATYFNDTLSETPINDLKTILNINGDDDAAVKDTLVSSVLTTRITNPVFINKRTTQYPVSSSQPSTPYDFNTGIGLTVADAFDYYGEDSIYSSITRSYYRGSGLYTEVNTIVDTTLTSLVFSLGPSNPYISNLYSTNGVSRARSGIQYNANGIAFDGLRNTVENYSYTFPTESPNTYEIIVSTSAGAASEWMPALEAITGGGLGTSGQVLVSTGTSSATWTDIRPGGNSCTWDTTIYLSQADVETLGTDYTLVPAGTSQQFFKIISAYAYTNNTIPYTNTNMRIYQGSQYIATDGDVLQSNIGLYARAFEISDNADFVQPGSPLTLRVGDGNPTGGDGLLTIFLTYQKLDIDSGIICKATPTIDSTVTIHLDTSIIVSCDFDTTIVVSAASLASCSTTLVNLLPPLVDKYYTLKSVVAETRDVTTPYGGGLTVYINNSNDFATSLVTIGSELLAVGYNSRTFNAVDGAYISTNTGLVLTGNLDDASGDGDLHIRLIYGITDTITGPLCAGTVASGFDTTIYLGQNCFRDTVIHYDNTQLLTLGDEWRAVLPAPGTSKFYSVHKIMASRTGAISTSADGTGSIQFRCDTSSSENLFIQNDLLYNVDYRIKTFDIGSEGDIDAPMYTNRPLYIKSESIPTTDDGGLDFYITYQLIDTVTGVVCKGAEGAGASNCCVDVIDSLIEQALLGIADEIPPFPTYEKKDTMVTVLSASIQGCGTSPVDVLPALGSGKYYRFTAVEVKTNGTTGYTVSSTVNLFQHSTINFFSNQLEVPPFITGATSETYAAIPNSSNKKFELNQPVRLSTDDNADPTTGDGDWTFYFQYEIVTP
jgi:hypothetical protein